MDTCGETDVDGRRARDEADDADADDNDDDDDADADNDDDDDDDDDDGDDDDDDDDNDDDSDDVADNAETDTAALIASLISLHIFVTSESPSLTCVGFFRLAVSDAWYLASTPGGTSSAARRS